MTRGELLENLTYDKARGVLIWSTANPLRMKFNGRGIGKKPDNPSGSSTYLNGSSGQQGLIKSTLPVILSQIL